MNIRKYNLEKQKTSQIQNIASYYNTNENTTEMVKINDFYDNQWKYGDSQVCVKGKVFKIDKVQFASKFSNKQGIKLTFYITDYNSSIIAVKFLTNLKYFIDINVNDWIKIYGKRNVYNNEPQIKVIKILKIEPEIINSDLSRDFVDDADIKRIELHTHTKMTTMDGVSSAKDYIKAAFDYKGYNAIAITDLNGCQAFPEAYNEFCKIKKIRKNIKLIYGVEFNLVDTSERVLINYDKEKSNSLDKIIVFDLETTGLYPGIDEIIEFSGKKIKKDKNGSYIVVDSLSILIKPTISVKEHITNITNITNKLLQEEGHEYIDGLKKIYKFISNSTLMAHNATFDYNFLKFHFEKYSIGNIKNTIIDTLNFARFFGKKRKGYSLKYLSKINTLFYEQSKAHRAEYDVELLIKVWDLLLNESIKLEFTINTITDIYKYEQEIKKNNPRLYYKFGNLSKIIILAKNQSGLQSLYKLITIANTSNFFGSPQLFFSDIEKYRKNLIIISAGIYGEIFNLILNTNEKNITKQIKKYDAIEVNPKSNYTAMFGDHRIDEKLYENLTDVQIQYAIKNKIIYYGSGNAFYIYKNEKIARDILIATKQIGKRNHYLFSANNIKRKNPDHHLFSTKELLNEFSFLNKEILTKLVVHNTIVISNQISENILPIKNKLYPPKIVKAKENILQFVYKNANEIYGKKLNKYISDRIEEELKVIFKNKYEIIYWIAHLLVKKSYDDNYIVGSRGSVGSSFIAFLLKITEVNSLHAHYYCKNCSFFDLQDKSFINCGFDLEDKNCPKCNKKLNKDGQNVPFETFLGFEGKKVPDIDLNFDANYQSTAQAYIKKLFDDKHCFKAGTILTIQSKTAYAIIKKYLELMGIYFPYAEITRLTLKLVGIKRTTGTHPGGIIIVPRQFSVFDFFPYNYAADLTSSDWFTTHFDFESIHDSLLKIDALGHMDPAMIKRLYKTSNIDSKKVTFDDKKVLSIFSSNDALHITKDFPVKIGTLAVSEFNTDFVMNILKSTKPKSFSDLVRVCGLAHGTNVWLNNQQSLIANKNNTIDLASLITSRDDIMIKLKLYGIDDKIAFSIMEDVRKGRGLSLDYEHLLKINNVEQTYIDTFNKITYMFPKAHAIAYVLMAWRIAWFKVYYPLDFYSAFFSLRAKEIDYKLFLLPIDEMTAYLKSNKINSKSSTKKQKDLHYSIQVALEMKLRGINFLNVSLKTSHSTDFLINKENNCLLLPFSIINGMGTEISNSIINERKIKYFDSYRDLKERTKLNKNHLKFFNDNKLI